MEIELNFRSILKTALVAQWLILIVYVYASKDTTWRAEIGVRTHVNFLLALDIMRKNETK